MAVCRQGVWRGGWMGLMVVCALGVLAPLALGGCHEVNRQPSIEDGSELDSALRGFHKNLRWARYEQAAMLVSVSYKQTFLGRYEELGEDFHITELEIKNVEMKEGSGPGAASAVVEVEQQWYKEPQMTIKKDRYMEVWERSRDGWKLTERMERDEWREREKEKAAAVAAKTSSDDKSSKASKTSKAPASAPPKPSAPVEELSAP